MRFARLAGNSGCPRRSSTATRFPDPVWPSAVSVPRSKPASRPPPTATSCRSTPSACRAIAAVTRPCCVSTRSTRWIKPAPLADLRVRVSDLTPERLVRLRHADAIVRRLSHSSGFDRRIWQFPVVLIPLGTGAAPDSVVLRPIDSVDGMTAQSVAMPHDLLDSISTELLSVPGVSGVFYDLTHKPPATIEWE